MPLQRWRDVSCVTVNMDDAEVTPAAPSRNLTTLAALDTIHSRSPQVAR